MYKVFFNQKSIVISASGNITLKKSSAEKVDFWSAHDVSNWFAGFEKSGSNEVELIHPDPARFFELFRSVFFPVYAAGGVVCRGKAILGIFRNGRWDLPKGKIDRGETAPKAALREVNEECAITGHEITRSLPSTYHIYRSPYPGNAEVWILKETYWFEMKYTGSSDGIPQTDEGITHIRWFMPNELDEVYANTWENLKQILDFYKKP